MHLVAITRTREASDLQRDLPALARLLQLAPYDARLRLASTLPIIVGMGYELGAAQVLPQDDIPCDIVTMNSTVSLRDLTTNEVETYTLVFPESADIANHKLSVLAPIGTTILGKRVGDELRWRVLQGWRKVKVEQVFRPGRA